MPQTDTNRTYNLVFVIHGLPMGGAEKFLITILNHFVKIGLKPVLLLLSHDIPLINEINTSVEIRIISKKSKYDLGHFFRIKKQIKSLKPDLIFCINPYAFFTARLLLYFNKQYLFCLSHHSTIPITFINYLKNYIYLSVVRKNDLIAYLCDHQRKYLKAKYHLNTYNEPIINNGIDFNHFNKDLISLNQRICLKSKLKIFKTEKTILFVARITNEKRHIDAIHVLKKINEASDIKHHLLIIGDGKMEDVSRLKEAVINLNLQHYIHFLGSIHDVRPFYAIADLCVLTSCSETFSIAVLESFSFGVPVSITNVGGASEMVSESFNGTLASPFNIEEMVSMWQKALKIDTTPLEIRNNAQFKYALPLMLDRYKHTLFEYIDKNLN